MDDWVIVCEVDCHVFPFEELLKMFPVVNFLIQLKAVVILIHLHILWVIPNSQP